MEIVDNKYLELGKFVALHGIRGELRAEYYCDSCEVMKKIKTFYLENGKSSLQIESCREHKNIAIIKIANLNDANKATELIGKTFYALKCEIKLPKDAFLIDDIMGMTVIDIDSDEIYGTINNVFQNGSADVYQILTSTGKELLFPAISEILMEINVEKGYMKIKPLPNLFLDEGDDEDNDED